MRNPVSRMELFVFVSLYMYTAVLDFVFINTELYIIHNNPVVDLNSLVCVTVNKTSEYRINCPLFHMN
jgi:hypothetical protein